MKILRKRAWEQIQTELAESRAAVETLTNALASIPLEQIGSGWVWVPSKKDVEQLRKQIATIDVTASTKLTRNRNERFIQNGK